MIAGGSASPRLSCAPRRAAADGLIDEFCVMVRPLSGAKALSEAMAVEFESAKRELGLA